nr:heat shock cognate 71 kDa protein-like [Procambarus clarkii]
MPSCVAFTDTERLIGDAAKNQVVSNPNNTIFDVKRLIGWRFDDYNVQPEMKYWPCNAINEYAKPKIQVEYKGVSKKFCPEEISSMLLMKMKETAEAYLGTTVKDAVITVPAYFNNSQRQATKDAGTISGLNVLHIINEPTAAAIAYGFDKNVIDDRNVLIFDLGGGSLDVSVLTIGDGEFQVKSTAGDTDLGGEDFDNRLMNHFLREFKLKYKRDVGESKRSLVRLRIACEHAKRTLSSTTSATVEIDSFEGVDFHSSITRAQFEELCEDLFLVSIDLVEKVLSDANMDKGQIHDIILVGGSTRIPKIQKRLKDFFDGKEPNQSINPDETVACGAAVQAAILCGGKSTPVQHFIVLDVTSLSLGIETPKGMKSGFIKRNTPIPMQKKYNFSTFVDNQLNINFGVYEGERWKVVANKLLGRFVLTGIPLATRRIPQIEVTFSIDANGILNLSALCMSTAKAYSITILEDKDHLSKGDIERMAQEAKKYKAEDEKQRERISAKSALEFCCFNIKSFMEEGKFKNNVSDDDRNTMLEACNDAIKWLDDNERGETVQFEHRMNKLNRICSPIIKKIRESSEGACGGSPDTDKKMIEAPISEEEGPNQRQNIKTKNSDERRERNISRNVLRCYCEYLKWFMEENYGKVVSECNRTIKWLHDNPEASKEECQDMRQRVEKVVQATLTNLNHGAGSNGGSGAV